VQDDRHRPRLWDQVGDRVALVDLPAPLRVVLAPGQVAEAAVRVPEHERVRQRRPVADLKTRLEEDLHVHRGDHDVVHPDRLDVEVVRRVAVLHGGHELRRPVLVLLRRADLPVERAARRPLLARPLPVGQDLTGPLRRRQLVVLERDGRLRGREMRAGVAVDLLPRREEDVRDVPERAALTGPCVGADARCDLERLAAELEADAVLRVPAVDLVPDADARVDVAAAALEEEGEPAEAALQHVTCRAGVVRGGNL
jgi:hypothetical protein